MEKKLNSHEGVQRHFYKLRIKFSYRSLFKLFLIKDFSMTRLTEKRSGYCYCYLNLFNKRYTMQILWILQTQK